MAAGFRIRRIRSEQSIGDKLKRARVRKRLSISEVEEATKVRSKFLLCLESDSWDTIPSEVYGRGYLEQYATYLGLSKVDIMAQYERERLAYARRCQDAQVQLAPSNAPKLTSLALTPRTLAIAGVSLFALGVIAVAGQQLSRFLSAPYLQLAGQVQASPNREVVVQGTSYTVAGRTSPSSRVEVNGEPAPVTESGDFNATIPVQEGSNLVKVVATNQHNVAVEERFLLTVVP